VRDHVTLGHGADRQSRLAPGGETVKQVQALATVVVAREPLRSVAVESPGESVQIASTANAK
jgi:hypothetical protein